MKYYGIFNCSSRSNSWKRTVTADFPDDETPQMVMGIMSHIGYFGGKEEKLEIYKEYRKYYTATEEEKKVIRVERKLDGEWLWEDEEDAYEFLLDDFGGFIEDCKKQIVLIPGTNSFYCVAEEWNGGIGKSKEDAKKSFILSEGVEEEDWEE
jgi:hypothetical protein